MRRISGSGFKGWPRPVSLCAAILMSAATWTPLAAEGLNANQQRAFDIYKELIEINTVTATGDTAKAAEAMAARLRAGGFPDADVHAFSPAPRKGNLVARLQGHRRAQADPAGRSYRRGSCQPRGLVDRSVQADRAGRLFLCPRQRRRQIHGGGLHRQSHPLPAGRLQARPRHHRGAGDRRRNSRQGCIWASSGC